MEGVVSISGTTMTMTVDATGGSGTFASWTIGATGSQGAQGSQGTQGNKGGVRYTFSAIGADSDPGAGNFRYNAITAVSTTFIYIDAVDNLGNDMTNWILSFDDSSSSVKGQLTIIGNTINDVNIFNVTGSVVTAVGYYKIPVSFVGGSTPSPADTAFMMLSFSRTGDLGTQGATGATGSTGATGAAGTNGTNGTNGAGVPVGGTANQVLAKIDATNYNTQWVTAISLAGNNAFTGANTFQSISGVTSFYSASTQDGINIVGRNGGSTSLRASIVPTTLTASRTITLPDATGTVITTGNLSSITSVGTLAGLTSSSRIWAQTDLRVGNASSTVLSSDAFALIVTPQGYTGLPVRIGEHYSIASVGTQNSQFTVFAGPATGGEVIFKRASNTTIASLNSNGLYLSEGWLRTYGTRGWYSETYGGGIYMDDVNTVKVYNGKAFYAPSSISSGNNISAVGSISAGGMIGLSGAGIAYYGSTIGGGSANQIGFRWTNPYVNCTVDNVISAPSANFSDRRLKTNIKTLTNGIELVRQLRCVTYNPLDVIGFEEETFEPIIGDLDPYDEMLGFIADEVQEVYANAVNGIGNNLKSIDNVQILSMAIAAIQQMDQRLQLLENK